MRFRNVFATFLQRVAVLFTLAGGSLTLAQAVPTIGTGGADDAATTPYRGTAVSYGHSFSLYNPTPEVTTWSHRIGITPEWHFNKHFFLRGRFFLSQDLTLSDFTTRPYEVELSDLWVDAVWGGWKEKRTGIRLGADVRVILPTSKPSIAATRLFTLGPAANISRSFNVLSGLVLVYSGRFTYRFNRLATRQNQGGLISNCNFTTPVEECSNTSTGARNVAADIIHGPTAIFSPHEKVTVSGTFLLQHGWLSPVGPTPDQYANVPELQVPTKVNGRDFVAFSMGVTYQPIDMLSITLGAFTFSNQLASDGTYIFPLFNRNTVASLDLTFDVEATVSRITKEKK
jgi:hypothetical protein